MPQVGTMPGPLLATHGQLADLSEKIRVGQRDLEHMQKLEVMQLRSALDDRDKALVEAGQRFELLKDDFQYNLKLIEARDKEIERLDQIIKQAAQREGDLEQKVRNLTNMIEVMQTKEVGRLGEVEKEKMAHKASCSSNDDHPTL